LIHCSETDGCCRSSVRAFVFRPEGAGDDVPAGRTIGKMLAFFFHYADVVMSFVAWWTWTVRFGN
jgi:hypothetical protein